MLGELRKAGANRLAIGMTLGLLASQSLAAPTRLEYVEQTLSVDGVEQTVSIPAGYRMEALVSDLGAPRLLTFGEDGELFIGSQSGEVYRLRPPYDKAELLLTLRGYPHSLARRKGELLIARTNGLYRITYQPGEKDLKVSDIGLLAPVPGGGGHNSPHRRHRTRREGLPQPGHTRELHWTVPWRIRPLRTSPRRGDGARREPRSTTLGTVRLGSTQSGGFRLASRYRRRLRQ